MDTLSDRRYDAIAFGAHPDDLEVVMDGTAAKLARAGQSILFVDLCEGEPARHASRGARHEQAVKAADILGVERTMLTLQDRLIQDTVEARIEVAIGKDLAETPRISRRTATDGRGRPTSGSPWRRGTSSSPSLS